MIHDSLSSAGTTDITPTVSSLDAAEQNNCQFCDTWNSEFEINPATGLPMSGMLDVDGNPYGLGSLDFATTMEDEFSWED